MIAFLTSHIGGSYRIDGKRYPTYLNNDNALVDQLRKRWPSHCKMLLIGTAPDCFERNDSLLECFRTAFPMSGLPVSEMDVCDDRNEQTVGHLLDYDVIRLAGGHVPTQNAFFRKIRLRHMLRKFKGTVMGISAGSMNMAGTVYVQPEECGESLDPNFRLFVPGLNLTHVNILPHCQKAMHYELDGKRLYEDVTYADSIGHEFFALPDNSYFFQDDDGLLLCGKAYRLRDGIIEQLTDDEDVLDTVLLD